MDNRIIENFIEEPGKCALHYCYAKIEPILSICEKELGAEVCSVQNISPLCYQQKSAFLIRFSDGRAAKLRITEAKGICFETNIKLVQKIGASNFPKVLIFEDGWTLFDWVEGETILKQGATPGVLDRAGWLLTSIHAARASTDRATRTNILRKVQRKLQQKLPVLVSKHVITAVQSNRIRELGDALSPENLDVRLIHGDFSPANLVVHGNELLSIDNENIRLHVADYDVCRAVAYWDEWNSSGQHLLTSYLQHSGRTLAPESLYFWEVFDLVYRISHRILHFGEFNSFYISRLKERFIRGDFL